MHPALQVPEILCLIFKCGFTECDLSNCARVCRLWGIWAMDVLWRTCRVPLQQVLQALAPVPVMRDEDNREKIPIFNIENIDEHKWRRFVALTSKISRIEIDCGLTGGSLYRIEFAKQTFNGEPFSQLQTLKTYYGCGYHDPTSLALATVPSLTSVYLRCKYTEGNSPFQAWVNESLPAVAPNITHFQFWGWYNAKLDLSRYSALRSIEVRADYMRPRFWEALASCRLLTKVLLKDCHDVPLFIEGWRAVYVQFPALCTFKMRGGKPQTALKLVLRSRMPMLECLAWDSQTGGGDEHAKNLFTMVPHLKMYSPRLDVEALYASSNFDDGGFTDSDGESW